MSNRPLKKAKFLEIHLPSHTPFYAKQRGLFHEFLNTLGSKTLRYPIISPIKLSKVYEFDEEKELLDQEIYTTLQWQNVCKLINEYQYDLILDLGPGDAMTHLLNNKSSTIITASGFKSVAGFCKAVSSELESSASK